jgi:hypothetical protein
MPEGISITPIEQQKSSKFDLGKSLKTLRSIAAVALLNITPLFHDLNPAVAKEKPLEPALEHIKLVTKQSKDQLRSDILEQMRSDLIISLESGNSNITEAEILHVSNHGQESFKTNGGGVTEYTYKHWQQQNGITEIQPLEKMTIQQYWQIQDSYLKQEWKNYPVAVKAFLQQVNYNSPAIASEIEQKFSEQLNNISNLNTEEMNALLGNMGNYQKEAYIQSSPVWAKAGLVRRADIALKASRQILKVEKSFDYRR